MPPSVLCARSERVLQKLVNRAKVHIRADCICVHSDTPNAVAVAQAVKTAVADYLG